MCPTNCKALCLLKPQLKTYGTKQKTKNVNKQSGKNTRIKSLTVAYHSQMVRCSPSCNTNSWLMWVGTVSTNIAKWFMQLQAIVVDTWKDWFIDLGITEVLYFLNSCLWRKMLDLKIIEAHLCQSSWRNKCPPYPSAPVLEFI